MTSTREGFLLIVHDLLEQTRETGLNESEKHFLVRKYLLGKKANVTVPRLGLIRFSRQFYGKNKGTEYYEIRDLRHVSSVASFEIEDISITLEQCKYVAFAVDLKEKTKLRRLEESTTSKIPYEGEWITARLFRVIDGDTLLLGILLPGKEALKISLRVAGIDCPETKRTCEAEVNAGLTAKRFVEALFKDVVLVQVCLTALDKWGGRWVGEVRVPEDKCVAGERCLGTLLLKKGLAKKYGGGKKEEWTSTELSRICSSF